MKKNKQILKIKGMEFFKSHGVYEFEKKMVSKFVIDIEIEGDFETSMHSDNLNDTVDYVTIYNKVSEVLNHSSNLIEFIVAEISKEILPILSTGYQLKIEIHKMNPPLYGQVKETAFEAIFIK